MSSLESFVSDLQEFLIGIREINHNIIRRHSKKLERLGDVSFPLNIKNWYHLLHEKVVKRVEIANIFDYKYLGNDINTQIECLKRESLKWRVQIEKIIVSEGKTDVYIFIAKTPVLYRTILGEVLDAGNKYGSSDIIKNNIRVETCPKYDFSSEVDLSILRLHLLKDVTLNLLKSSSSNSTDGECAITIALNPVENGFPNVLCGPVLSESGAKSTNTVQELYEKRANDMRMMAQHKYGVQIKPNLSWEAYFEKLGKASVTIEMLSNKPQKPIKITLNDLQSANKGASFIFYNCARLSALFKEFDKLISRQAYPELPEIDCIQFSLLCQPEEWELFYVYIWQYPVVIKNCIKDIDKGILNPQYLISFLSNLTSIFSVYYRRVRILTNPREHMFAVIHARIYLLKAVQHVFHNALSLLHIDPINEM